MVGKEELEELRTLLIAVKTLERAEHGLTSSPAALERIGWTREAAQLRAGPLAQTARLHLRLRAALEDRGGERGYIEACVRYLVASELREVRLCVIVGSFARDDADEDSDIDLLVSFAPSDESWPDTKLAFRVEDMTGRRVDVIELRRAGPTLLRAALVEGIVVADPDSEWPRVQARAEQIADEAERYEQELAKRARIALDQMIGRRSEDA
jgi:predicted nucleotidyltransferase